MSEGRIYYAENRGSYYLRFVGDVRVTLCTTLSRYVDHIFSEQCLCSIVVDLRDAKGVDSTTLGFMAKVAIFSNEREVRPMLIVEDPSMIRLIEGMGFDEIFQIIPDFPETEEKLEELEVISDSTKETRQKVIESHKVLMSMNSKNMKAFSSLVGALQKESE